MATAIADERSYYLDDFADELVPCDTTLEGWATWLSKPDPQWSRDSAASDGDRFRASILRWGEDVVAKRIDGAWSLSREPEGDAALVAVRYGQGTGWDPENIIGGEIELDPATGEYRAAGTPASNLLRWLSENDAFCDDEEFVAIGFNEPAVMLTYRADPPRFETAAVQ